VLLHLLHDVLVADGRAQHSNIAFLQRQFEPDVAHHGCDHGTARQTLFALQLIARDQENGVAVNGVAMAVDKQRPIAVAVEGDAKTRGGTEHLVAH
jgi:hypothetical protein